jgi:RNA polymerase sigma-70 factor (ECF subfamily)
VTEKARHVPLSQGAATEGEGASASTDAGSRRLTELDASIRRLTELYEQHVDFVWRSVRLLGLGPDVADDAVQDVFLVAHRRLADFEARSGPRTWLFAIAMRVVSNHRRSSRRRSKLLEREQALSNEPASAHVAFDPFHHAVSAERRQILLDAIEALPHEQRVVFMLVELEEMTAPEVACALDVKLNTVYSRLRAARRAVSSCVRAPAVNAADAADHGEEPA